MKTELPKNWYIRITEDNKEELDTWRKTVATEYKSLYLAIGCFILSEHHCDNSHYYATRNEEELLRKHPGYTKITIEQFREITNPKINYTIPGTKIPDLPIGTKYRVEHWRDDAENCIFNHSRENFVSYGSKMFKDELYILVEEEDYEFHKPYMIKLSDIQKLKPIKPIKIRKITPQQAQEIINAACMSWKKRLADLWATQIVLDDTIIIEEDFYQEMREACDPDQHKLFDKIFGKDEVFIPKDTLCIVKDRMDAMWRLAYSDGEGRFSIKKGDYPGKHKWDISMPLDVNNIP